MMTTFIDEDNYQVIMEEQVYYRSLSDFLDAGRSQGFYNAFSELIDLCPIYDRPLLFKAIQQIAKEVDK